MNSYYYLNYKEVNSYNYLNYNKVNSYYYSTTAKGKSYYYLNYNESEQLSLSELQRRYVLFNKPSKQANNKQTSKQANR